MQPPPLDSLHAYDWCVAYVDEPDRQRYVAARPSIAAAAKTYRSAAEQGRLGALTAANLTLRHATVADMGSLYDRHFRSRPGAARRLLYDMILNSRKLCAYCRQGIVRQLDHFLPRAAFGAVAVDPANLVPVCADCNRSKLDQVGQTEAQSFVHPYFDDTDSGLWLNAHISEIDGQPALRMFVDRGYRQLPDMLYERLTFHFDKLGYAERYETYGNIELAEAATVLRRMKGDVVGAASAGQRVDMLEYLREQSRVSATVNRNGWKPATYRAALRSDWFIDFGVDRLLPDPRGRPEL